MRERGGKIQNSAVGKLSWLMSMGAKEKKKKEREVNRGGKSETSRTTKKGKLASRALEKKTAQKKGGRGRTNLGAPSQTGGSPGGRPWGSGRNSKGPLKRKGEKTQKYCWENWQVEHC